MNIKEFAAMLNGREIGCELSPYEAQQAKDLGFVVVYGASDDLMEFEGAICDEVGCYDGGTVRITPTVAAITLAEGCKEVFPYKAQIIQRSKKLKAVWGKGDISWTYETDIPHETFDIFEDGELYCRGIVFELSQLAK